MTATPNLPLRFAVLAVVVGAITFAAGAATAWLGSTASFAISFGVAATVTHLMWPLKNRDSEQPR